MLVYGDGSLYLLYVQYLCIDVVSPVAAFVLDTSMFVFINSRWKQHM